MVQGQLEARERRICQIVVRKEVERGVLVGDGLRVVAGLEGQLAQAVVIPCPRLDRRAQVVRLVLHVGAAQQPARLRDVARELLESCIDRVDVDVIVDRRSHRARAIAARLPPHDSAQASMSRGSPRS
jgi:hypothetical protein